MIEDDQVSDTSEVCYGAVNLVNDVGPAIVRRCNYVSRLNSERALYCSGMFKCLVHGGEKVGAIRFGC